MSAAGSKIGLGRGGTIEIHVDSDGLRDFFEMVRGAAEVWDGSEPLRPVES